MPTPGQRVLSELADEPGIRERLAALPRLRSNTIATSTCKICGHAASLFDVVDFNKVCGSDFYFYGLAGIPVTYYRCWVCSFIFTTFFDGWSAEDFTQFIYNDDYAVVDPDYVERRPIQSALALSALLGGCEHLRMLDYGSGSGKFAGAMATRGFADVTGYDPFSAPTRPQGKFDVITCLETIEHTVDPLGTLSDMTGFLAEDGAILIGQSLQPPNIRELRGNWWYIGPRNGHVSIFAEDTFVTMAERSGLVFRPWAGFYGFARPNLSPPLQATLGAAGSAAFVTTLRAPAHDDPCWHGAEIYTSAMRFRWTQVPRVRWPAQAFRPGLTKIRIPFLMEIAPGFAAGCRIFADEVPLPTEVTPTEIVARIDVPEGAAAAITLVTPEPLSPAAVHGSPDSRLLGLAVGIADPR